MELFIFMLLIAFWIGLEVGKYLPKRPKKLPFVMVLKQQPKFVRIPHKTPDSDLWDYQ